MSYFVGIPLPLMFLFCCLIIAILACSANFGSSIVVFNCIHCLPLFMLGGNVKEAQCDCLVGKWTCTESYDSNAQDLWSVFVTLEI